ncbi:unnamed protein product [Paramecium sonneborni]|uniref:Pyridoxal phosphate phosphatase PHOSPHO2 n=1 Tax=Paramecium sonneborni TaxID=65129 RepID=A0A8S1QW58_9CILI|nr:unnamed protein product [Paramecium sonneborni]
MLKKRFLFIFDFDNTIVNDNTDTYIWKLLPQGQKSLPSQFEKEKHWNKFMRKVLQFYYHNDISVQQIKSCLQEMELTQGFGELFDFIRTNKEQIECIIASDSNTYFIDSILDKQGFKDVIDKIYTNPVQIIDDMEISIFPYHKNDCESTCPRNMCKRTIIMDNYQLTNYEKVCYFGDGKNDYCPGTILRNEDIIFVRKGYGLEKLIQKKDLLCEKVYFESGIDCINRLKNLFL